LIHSIRFVSFPFVPLPSLVFRLFSRLDCLWHASSNGQRIDPEQPIGKGNRIHDEQ
jgi:hypothetical protein